jgi:hypothetical protein
VLPDLTQDFVIVAVPPAVDNVVDAVLAEADSATPSESTTAAAAQIEAVSFMVYKTEAAR